MPYTSATNIEVLAYDDPTTPGVGSDAYIYWANSVKVNKTNLSLDTFISTQLTPENGESYSASLRQRAFLDFGRFVGEKSGKYFVGPTYAVSYKKGDPTAEDEAIEKMSLSKVYK